MLQAFIGVIALYCIILGGSWIAHYMSRYQHDEIVIKFKKKKQLKRFRR